MTIFRNAMLSVVSNVYEIFMFFYSCMDNVSISCEIGSLDSRFKASGGAFVPPYLGCG